MPRTDDEGTALGGKDVTLVLGADYAGYGDPLESGLALNGFAGYETDGFAVGAEGVWNRIGHDAAGDEEVTTGVSLFARTRVQPAWYVVGRYDRVYVETPAIESYQNFGILGVAYQPVPQVRFIPNLVLTWLDGGNSAATTARVTLELDI